MQNTPTLGPLVNIVQDQNISFALLGVGQMQGGDCLIVIASEKESSQHQVIARYEGATGNVYALEHAICASNIDDSELQLKAEPAVLIIGETSASTGQLKVRQPEGNYLRLCRWDRIEGAGSLKPNAILRTLPQCGCGGSLGVPQLFDSFAEMSAYYFCAFYRTAQLRNLESSKPVKSSTTISA